MPYGLNQYGQFSDSYKNKLASVGNSSAMGYNPSGYSPSSVSYKKANGFSTWSSDSMKQTLEENKGRTTLDRVFDSLSVFNYTMMGGAKNYFDDRDDTSVLDGVWAGLKASNPFGDGYQKGEVTATDVLTELGWKPKGVVGGVAKFGTGLALDIFTDPTTYMTFGISGLLKGTGIAGRTAVKTADATSDALKAFTKVDGITDDVIQGADKIINRRVTPEDVKELFKKNNTVDEFLTNDDYIDLAKRANKYAGLETDYKRSSLAFDFFSDKSWGFRKEFVSGEKMAELGDRLGTAPFVQSIIDEIVMHPSYAKLGKEATKHVLARTDMNKLLSEMRAKDLASGLYSKALKTQADVRSNVKQFTDKLTEDELKAVTKNLEDAEQFFSYKKYNNVSDTEEGMRIIENIAKERDAITTSVNKVTDLYNLYKVIDLKNKAKIDKLEKKKADAFAQSYNAKNTAELIQRLQNKYKDVDSILSEIDRVVKYAEEKVNKNSTAVEIASKLDKLTTDSITTKALEIRDADYFNDLEDVISATQINMSKTGVARNLKTLKDDIDRLEVSSSLNKQANILKEHIESFKTRYSDMDEFTKVDLETGEIINKTTSEINAQKIKSTKSTNSVKLYSFTDKIAQENMQAPYGWNASAYPKQFPKDRRSKDYRDFVDSKLTVFSNKFDKDLIEVDEAKFTIKEMKEAKSLMHLLYPNSIDEIITNLDNKLNGVRNTEISSELLKFMQKYNPPMYEYYSSLNFVRDIYSADTLNEFKKMMFNTSPNKLADSMVRFTQNYPAVNTIMTFRDIKIIPKNTEDSIEDIIKNAVKMYGDNVKYSSYKDKGSLISYINRQYYSEIDRIISSDNYMNDWLIKFRSKTDMEKLKQGKYAPTKSKANMVNELKDDTVKANFYSDSSNINKVVNAILYAPKGVIDSLKNVDVSNFKQTFETAKKDLDVNKSMYAKTKKLIEIDEQRLNLEVRKVDNKLSEIIRSSKDLNITKEDMPELIKSARNDLELELMDLRNKIKQNKVKLTSYKKNIDICEKSMTRVRSEMMDDVSSMKVAFEDSYRLFKYEGLNKVVKKQKEQKVKLEKHMLDASEISKKGKDGYMDYRNTSEWSKEMEHLSSKETTEQYQARVETFISEMVNAIDNASRKAVDDLGMESDEVSMFYKIKKGIAHNDDSIAYDIYSKLKSSDMYDEVISRGKLELTEADFTTQLVKKFLKGKTLSDISNDDVVRIETYVAKAQEDGLLTKQVDSMKAEQLSELVRYVQRSKDSYVKNGGNVEDINKLEIDLSDYNEHLRKIEDGAFIWDDLKSMADKTKNNMDYEIKHLNVEDVKLSKLEDREMEKITQPVKEPILRRANALLDRLERDDDTRSELFILQKRLDSVVGAIGQRDVAIERVEDLIELRNQIDLSRIDSLSASVKYGKNYVAEQLNNYDNISDFINDANLKAMNKTVESAKRKIATTDDKIEILNTSVKDIQHQLAMELKNAKRISGMEVKYDIFGSGIDDFISDLEMRSRQLDGLIETMHAGTSFDDTYSEAIDKFFGRDIFNGQYNITQIRNYINEKMAYDVVDKTKFIEGTSFNKYQQDLSVMLAKEFENMKDLENINVFIKNYIPHMISPKYQSRFVEMMEHNPLASMMGLTLEKFNKHSLSRRWNMTIEEYKGIVDLVNSGDHLYNSKYYPALQEASMASVLKIVNDGKMTVKTPYNTEVMVRWNDKLNQFEVVGVKNQDLFNKTQTIEDINIKTGEYVKREANYTENGIDRLYSNFINGRITMDEDTLKVFDEIKPLLDVIKFADTRPKGYMKYQYKTDLVEGINPKVLNTVLEIGSDFFKKMPQDLFEENPLTLYLNRALYNNKLVVDEEVFPQIKSLLCREPIRVDRVLSDINDSEVFTIMHRDLENFRKENSMLLDTNINKVKFDIVDGELIYDRDRVKNNTFVTLTKEQADYINSIPSMRSLINVTDKRNLLEFNEVAQKQLNAGLESFLSVYDRAVRLWKLNVTVVSPSFHVTNKTGNAFNTFLDIGMDVFNKQVRKSAVDIVKNREGVFITKDGKRYTNTELLSYAIDLGVIDEGMFGKELRELIARGDTLKNDFIINKVSEITKIPVEKLVDWQKFNPLSAETFIPYQKGTELGSMQENIDRMVNWLSHINNGATMNEASERTKKFLFDYSKSSEFEKTVMKRVFPFWSFLKNNTKLQYQMLLEKPHIYRTVAKIRNEFEAQTPYEERLDKSKLNTYAKDWWQTPLERQTRTSSVDLLLNPNMPFQSLNLNLETIMSMISPILKAPYELGTGTSIYSGKPIYSSKLEYLSTQTFYGGTVSKLNSSTTDGKIIKLASALLGIKIGQYTEDKQNLLNRDALINNRLNYKDELNK